MEKPTIVPAGKSPSGYTLPRYKCHKEVGALKIAAIEIKKNGTTLIVPADEGFLPFEVPAFKLKFKGDEKDLGYYVVYEDGYDSWSPTLAFESGYTRIQIDSLGNAQQAAAKAGQKPEVNAVPDKPQQAAEPPKKTLEQACQEFIGVLDRVAYGSRRRKCPGDLMALRGELENFLKIGHGILKEPID